MLSIERWSYHTLLLDKKSALPVCVKIRAASEVLLSIETRACCHGVVPKAAQSVKTVRTFFAVR